MRGGVVVAGVVLMLLALFGWLAFVFNPLLGALLCIASPILFLVGLILFIVGLVVSAPQPMVYVAQQAPPAAMYAGVPPPAYPCPVCRQPLQFVQQYRRWYCPHCRQYR